MAAVILHYQIYMTSNVEFREPILWLYISRDKQKNSWTTVT